MIYNVHVVYTILVIFDSTCVFPVSGGTVLTCKKQCLYIPTSKSNTLTFLIIPLAMRSSFEEREYPKAVCITYAVLPIACTITSRDAEKGKGNTTTTQQKGKQHNTTHPKQSFFKEKLAASGVSCIVLTCKVRPYLC